MSPFRIALFGDLRLQRDSSCIEAPQSAKARELLCYLLVHRDRPHAREVLATLLWGERTTAQSKKYFRQTLWHLQQSLNTSCAGERGPLLQVDGDSLRVNSGAHLWLDIAAFESAFAGVRGMRGDDMGEQQAASLRAAVELYRGELLEGWYCDWCLFHRERLQNMFLSMLDKLAGFCEARHEYEAGYTYGELLLRQDPVRERTYRLLMRLKYLAGDRAGALRLFQRCEEVLQKELGVPPAERTVSLYNQLRVEHGATSTLPIASSLAGEIAAPRPAPSSSAALAVHLRQRLRKVRSLLLKVRHQLERDIRDVDEAIASYNENPSSAAASAGKTVSPPSHAH